MRKIFFIILVLLTVNLSFAEGLKDWGFKPLRKRLKYVEDLYRLYVEWLYPNTDSISRNIYFLELAMALPFDHPIKALTPITNPTQWIRYKYLIRMHTAVLLTKAYIDFAMQFYKPHVYFFNTQYKKEILDGYDVAEAYLKSAKGYWNIAKKYATKAYEIKGEEYKTQLIYIEDELNKIINGEIYYDETIARLLQNIKENRKKIEKMPEWEWDDPGF